MDGATSWDDLSLSSAPLRAMPRDALLIGHTAVPCGRARGGSDTQFASQDEPADKVFKLLRGAARSVHLTAEGGRKILAFHLPGDFIGLGGGEPGASLEAIQASEMLVARRSGVDAALNSDPAAAATAIQLLRLELARVRAHAAVLSLKGACERVAAFLVQYAARLPAGPSFELPMSRADIADHLALTIESVSRAFTQIERAGAIRLPRARQVEVANAAALRRMWTHAI